MMDAVARNSSEDVLRTVDRLLAEGHNPQHFARQMVRFLRNALVAKVAGGDSPLLQISSDERARVGARGRAFQRRGPGALSADHAAHPRRTRLQAGAALSSRTGPAEAGARAALAAAGAVAERRSGAERSARATASRRARFAASTGSDTAAAPRVAGNRRPFAR